MMQIRRQCIVEFGRAATQGCYAVCPPDLFIGAAIYRLAIVVLDVMVGTLACLRAHTYIMSQEAKEGKYINMWYICGCRWMCITQTQNIQHSRTHTHLPFDLDFRLLRDLAHFVDYCCWQGAESLTSMHLYWAELLLVNSQSSRCRSPNADTTLNRLCWFFDIFVYFVRTAILRAEAMNRQPVKDIQWKQIIVSIIVQLSSTWLERSNFKFVAEFGVFNISLGSILCIEESEYCQFNGKMFCFFFQYIRIIHGFLGAISRWAHSKAKRKIERENTWNNVAKKIEEKKCAQNINLHLFFKAFSRINSQNFLTSGHFIN